MASPFLKSTVEPNPFNVQPKPVFAWVELHDNLPRLSTDLVKIISLYVGNPIPPELCQEIRRDTRGIKKHLDETKHVRKHDSIAFSYSFNCYVIGTRPIGTSRVTNWAGLYCADRQEEIQCMLSPSLVTLWLSERGITEHQVKEWKESAQKAPEGRELLPRRARKLKPKA